MASYFRQVPNFEYVSRDTGDKYISEYIPVKNLFKRGKLREDIFGNLSFFEKYSIIGDERPDNVAYKFYDEETLDWVVLLSNNILNIQSEWPMTQQTFDKVMLEKYGSYDNLYNGIHHYETEEIKNSLGITVLKGGLKISPTWKTNGNFLEINNSKIKSIYAGDGITATKTITVELVNGIPGLRKGSQININNISENQYNGQYIIKEIITRGESNVKEFTYELSEVPNIASPILANPRKEEALFTLSANESIFIIALEEQTKFDFNYEVGDIEVYKNGGNLSESSFTANNGTSITLSTPCAEGDTIEVKSPQQLILANSYYYEYWDAGLGYSVLVPSTSFIKPITNYEYELKIEEAKRNIFILKPIYLSVIFNDMEELMIYKEGGDQYVNSTLKRGDNIRLFE
jgi:hypothetical protein